MKLITKEEAGHCRCGMVLPRVRVNEKPYQWCSLKSKKNYEDNFYTNEFGILIDKRGE
jgi:hypothetical protein